MIHDLTSQELEQLLPTFGMNDEILNEMPAEFSEHFGKGVKFWQYPNQFAPYLKHLSTLKINSYLEVGCRWGGTFILTTRLLGIKKGMACDLIPKSEILEGFNELEDFQYLEGPSADLSKIDGQFDLILIDGDHSYNGVKSDFETCLRFKPKYIAFHDIVNQVCPGVQQFWNEIKGQYPHQEFTAQYDSVNGTFLGIGLIAL
jgi:hypothetical protein